VRLKSLILRPRRFYPEDHPWQRVPEWYFRVVTVLVVLAIGATAVVGFTGWGGDGIEVSAPVAFLGAVAIAGVLTALVAQRPTRSGRRPRRLALVLLFAIYVSVFFLGALRAFG